jgi:hypothetical protein
MAEQYLIWETASLTGGAKTKVRSTPLPFKGRIRRITVKADANASGSATFDFNLQGTSVFATLGDRPVLAAGATQVEVSGLSIPHNKNDVLSLDADALPLGGLANLSVIVVSDDMLDDKPAPIEYFVRAMYLGALNREPSDSELAAALSSLTTACFSFGFTDAARTLATTIFTSSDFTSLTLTNTQFVVRLYKAYLNRDPQDPETLDTAGLNNWVTILNGGETRANVRNAFAVSLEFNNRTPVFCRNQAPSADATSIQGKAPDEFVRDAMATAFVDSADLDYSADDPGDTATAILKPTGVTAGTYGGLAKRVALTVDAKGRVSALTEYDGDAFITITVTTGALANDATANVNVDFGLKFWKLYQLTFDRSARARAYSRDAYRTADAARLFGTDPTGEHGLIFDFYLEAANLTWDCAPNPDGNNLDNLSSTSMFLAITNRSGATSTVTLTLKIRVA